MTFYPFSTANTYGISHRLIYLTSPTSDMFVLSVLSFELEFQFFFFVCAVHEFDPTISYLVQPASHRMCHYKSERGKLVIMSHKFKPFKRFASKTDSAFIPLGRFHRSTLTETPLFTAEILIYIHFFSSARFQTFSIE